MAPSPPQRRTPRRPGLGRDGGVVDSCGSEKQGTAGSGARKKRAQLDDEALADRLSTATEQDVCVVKVFAAEVQREESPVVGGDDVLPARRGSGASGRHRGVGPHG